MIPVVIRYSARNIWRGKGRNALVIILTAPMFLSLLLMLTNARALNIQAERLSRGTATLIQVRAPRSFGHINQAGGLNKMLTAGVEQRIARIRHVVKVEPYLVAIEPIAGYYMTLHTGVRPNDARRLATHGEAGKVKIVAGRDLSEGDEGKDVALLGIAYARKMGIALENFIPGKSIFVKDALRDGEPGVVKKGTRTIGGRPFRIVGLFTSGYAFGDNQMFLPYRTFQRHYGMKDRISKLFVRIDRAGNVAAAAREIRRTFPHLNVGTREDGASFMSKALHTMRRITKIWIILSAVLAALVVLFAMLLATDERIRELGVLKALGGSASQLAGVVLGESVLLASFSAGLGMLVFALAGSSLGRGFFKATLGIYLPGQYGDSLWENMTVGYSLSVPMIVSLMIAAAAAGFTGSLYSLWQVRRLSPIVAAGR
jgi:ABC-type lipoprotein release transport system permease subunit